MSDPSGPIQVIPPGLLGYLQIKNVGQSPDTLIGTYQPVFDMTEWILQANAVNWTQARGLAGVLAQRTLAPGAGATGVVPFNAGGGDITTGPGEWWYVHNFTVYTQVLDLATYSVQFAAAALNPLTGVGNYMEIGTDSGLVTGVATATGRRAVSHAGGFFIPPNTRLGMFVKALEAAVSIDFFGTCRFSSLPI